MRLTSLPRVRSGERMDYKRCRKKWYWRWRRGLRPRAHRFGPLELGTWLHEALAVWYGEGRKTPLYLHFVAQAELAISLAMAGNAPEHIIDKAEELAVLGEAMCKAYERYWQGDPNVRVIAAEVALEFTIPDDDGRIIAKHMLKPDLVFADEHDDVWLMEHKSAAQVSTEHLAIDDQARPYGAMAERSLRRLGHVRKGQRFRGIMYNFLRKALPDERETNAEGKYLNKNGSVSKKQPPPLFVRKPITMTRAEKVLTLQRVQRETIEITNVTMGLRSGQINPAHLMKTPHKSCPKTCDFWAMCVEEEKGTDIRDMERMMYIREDPYSYAESTDIPVGFEIG